MATIKSYTSLDQSKKLAEILPLESADMCYVEEEELQGYHMETVYTETLHTPYHDKKCIPCWSLTSLLGVLPKGSRLLKSATDDIYYHCDCPKGNIDEWFDNPVDACYELILKLHGLNLL